MAIDKTAKRKEWAKKNPEKEKAYHDIHWIRKAAEYGVDTPEEAKRIYQAEWRKKNKDRISEKNARYYKKLKERQAEQSHTSGKLGADEAAQTEK